MTTIHLHPREIVSADERRRYARLVREFCRGSITNDEYETAFDEHRWQDTAVGEIHLGLMWYLYDDLHEHRLGGKHKRTRPMRRPVVRALLRLDTEYPGYVWDHRAFRFCLLVATALVLFFLCLLLAFGAPLLLAALAGSALLVIALILTDRAMSRTAALDPSHVWPFLCADDEHSARSRPRLLAGSHAG